MFLYRGVLVFQKREALRHSLPTSGHGSQLSGESHVNTDIIEIYCNLQERSFLYVCVCTAVHRIQPWFHGGVSRTEAQRLLEEQGHVDGWESPAFLMIIYVCGVQYSCLCSFLLSAGCFWSVTVSFTCSASCCPCVINWRRNTTSSFPWVFLSHRVCFTWDGFILTSVSLCS